MEAAQWVLVLEQSLAPHLHSGPLAALHPDWLLPADPRRARTPSLGLPFGRGLNHISRYSWALGKLDQRHFPNFQHINLNDKR